MMVKRNLTALLTLVLMLNFNVTAAIQIEKYSPLQSFKVECGVENSTVKATVEYSGAIYRNMSLDVYVLGTGNSPEEKISMGRLQTVFAPSNGEPNTKSFSFNLPPSAEVDGRIICDLKDAATAINYYVCAETGSDSGSGAEDSPFQTIEYARDEIRRLKNRDGRLPYGGVTVHIKGGKYSLGKAINFTTEDSGAEGAPIVYTAYNNENVTIKGSRSVQFTDFDDAGLVDNRILKADLLALWGPDADIGEIVRTNAFTVQAGRPPSSMLYADGELQTIARYPNKNDEPKYLQTGVVTLGSSNDPNAEDQRAFMHNISASRIAKLQDDDLWARGFWRYNWYEDSHKATVDNTYMTLIPDNGTLNYGIGAGQDYYIYNSLSELDEPGEYYIERRTGRADTGVLYYLPENVGVEIELSTLKQPLISMSNVSNVIIQGIAFANSRYHGIQMTNCSNVLIEGCNFRGLGGRAIDISGGTDCGVLSCDIDTIGCGGIYLNGGDRVTLTPSMHYVENSKISNFCTESATYIPAISLDGVGNIARNNEIFDGPHLGISINGNDHEITNNELYNLCNDSDDAGAIYGGRDWTSCGNIIKDNYFHDIMGKRNNDAHAVYFDDMMSGNTVEGNVFSNISSAVIMHGSRSTTVKDNIIVNPRRYSVRLVHYGYPDSDDPLRPGGAIAEGQAGYKYNTELWTRYAAVFDESPGAEVIGDAGECLPKNDAWLKYNTPIPNYIDPAQINYRNLAALPYDRPFVAKYNELTRNIIYGIPAGLSGPGLDTLIVNVGAGSNIAWKDTYTGYNYLDENLNYFADDADPAIAEFDYMSIVNQKNIGLYTDRWRE